MEPLISSPNVSLPESDPLNLMGHDSTHTSVGSQVKINFQPADTEVPEGYIADYGRAYSEERGHGWVTQESLDNLAPTPLDISSSARERHAVESQRLDTLLHMQSLNRPAAAWEYDLPNGTYHVSVGVGDRSYFNSRHVINVEGIQAIEFLPTPQDPLESSSVQVEVTDGKLTVDAEGGNNTKINFLKIAPAQAVIDTRVNFQPEGALVPEGYTPDFGKAFSEEQGFGWITQASVGEVSTPLDISPNARDRNALDSQRLDTFIHMQYPTNANNSTAVKTPAAWEYTLPNGTYSVSVVVGDPRAFDSTHVINVEGVSAIDSFVPTSADPFEIATVEVEVTDGELTLDAIGGNNTKINYVSISSVASGFTTLNWSTVKPSPIGRVEAFGAAADGKLYVFGGFIDTTFYPTTRSNVYNPTTNTWAQIAPLPKPLSHGATAVDETVDGDGTDIYLAGGYLGQPDGTGQIFATRDVWKYNVGTNTWTSLTPLPQARGSGALELLDGNLHFFGGANIRREDRGEHWVLDLDGGTGWTRAAAMPNPRSHLADATLDGEIYAIGGQYDVDRDLVTQDSVHKYNPQSNTWVEVASLPQPLSHTGATTFVMDGRIIVTGGEVRHGSGGSVADVIAYDSVSNTWTELTPLPATRHSGVAAGIEGQIFYTTGAPGIKATTYKGIPA